MTCPICSWSSDNVDYLLLGETRYWRICLAPNQSLLGRCVVHLKRHADDLASLTEAEMLEFLTVVKSLEETMRLVFSATMFNWSCYMNQSYRESLPNPHVHWWAVPRYDHAVHHGDRMFEDPHFGDPYDHSRWLEVPNNVRIEIAEKIKSKLRLP